MTSKAIVFLIKLLHTAVFVFVSVALCTFFVAALSAASRGMLYLSIAIPSTVCILWWLDDREPARCEYSQTAVNVPVRFDFGQIVRRFFLMHINVKHGGSHRMEFATAKSRSGRTALIKNGAPRRREKPVVR
jgi:hypothetical protein